MGLLSSKTLAGPGYIILNILRAFNIIALLAIAAAHTVLLAKIHIASNFFFFDAVFHVIIVFITFFLILSESSLFKGYFARQHPLLSPIYGFVFLGLALMGLGFTTLGQLNQPNNTAQNMGLGFWRIVIGSGILAIVFGFFNILASFIFRDKANGVTARQIRGKGAVAVTQAPSQQPWHLPYHQQPKHEAHSQAPSFYTATSTTSLTGKNEKYSGKTPWTKRLSRFKSFLPTYNEQKPRPQISRPMAQPSPPSTTVEPRFNFRRQNSSGPPVAGGSKFNFSRKSSNAQSHRPYSPPPASSFYSDHGEDHDRRQSMQISGPLNINPQFAHLVPKFATMNNEQRPQPQRPDSAFHPARAGVAK